MRRKYFKSLKEAKEALKTKNPYCGYSIFKMPKGTRKHGWYAVCTELEFLNTY